jgi:hypothetical protein
MDMVKLNSRFEFPRKLNLSSYAKDAGEYILQAVVVHSGDVNSGHYYVLIRPDVGGPWYKFDDDSVTTCSDYAAVEDNFGGSDPLPWNYFDRHPRELAAMQPSMRPRIHNAYMLVYVREDCVRDVLQPPDPRDTNLKMVERFDREVMFAEQRRREKLEQQSRIKIRVVFEKDLCKLQGFWDHAELVHTENFKMARDQLVKDLAAEVEALTKVPRAHMILFVLSYRSRPRQVRFSVMGPNTTLRTHIPQYNAPHFDAADPFLTVLVVTSRGYSMQSMEWKGDSSMRPDELCRWSDETYILLVIRYFCPKTCKIITLGSYYGLITDPLVQMVDNGWVTERLQPYVQAGIVAPFPEGSKAWDCWEEFNERDIQIRNIRRSAKTEQLWSGDVLIWQPQSPREGDPEAEVPGGQIRLCEDPDRSDFEAPMYPVHNVQDFTLHQANAIDVTVTMHDSRQPLCIDGIISTGHYGPPRTASGITGADSGSLPTSPSSPGGKEEEGGLESQMLLMSPAQFEMPREKVLKMDTRWTLQHVVGTIAKAFGTTHVLNAKDCWRLWLFNEAPSTSSDDPVYINTRNDQMSLKQIQQSNPIYMTKMNKKPLAIHVVELPVSGLAVHDRNSAPVCLRFFDDAVREVGSCVIVVPNTATPADILAEAKRHIHPDWNMNGPLRALEVVDGQITRLFHANSRGMLSSKANIFYSSIRIEQDLESVTQCDHEQLEVFHCDRSSQQAFAQPFVLTVSPGELCKAIKVRIRTKLKVPDQEFKSWRLMKCVGARKIHLKDEEAWDQHMDHGKARSQFCLEHVHPNPSSNNQKSSRYNKPLTIK